MGAHFNDDEFLLLFNTTVFSLAGCAFKELFMEVHFNNYEFSLLFVSQITPV